MGFSGVEFCFFYSNPAAYLLEHFFDLGDRGGSSDTIVVKRYERLIKRTKMKYLFIFIDYVTEVGGGTIARVASPDTTCTCQMQACGVIAAP